MMLLGGLRTKQPHTLYNDVSKKLNPGKTFFV